MPSVWIRTRQTKDGSKRYRVEFNLHWRKRTKCGGSFKTKREAELRKKWIIGELAARRVPDLSFEHESERAPTLREYAESWQAARVDVSEGTADSYRIALRRILPRFGELSVSELTPSHVAELVAELTEKGLRKQTIRKT